MKGGGEPPPSGRARAYTHALHSRLLYLSKTFQGDLRERQLAASRVNQRSCQATGKLLFSPYTGQLGARIPSLLVRCHKPFIGRTAASLKNTSIKARRPPTSPGPKKGFKEVRDEEGSGRRGLGRRALPVPSLHNLWGEGIFVRILLLILGCPLDQHPLPRPGTAGIPSSQDNTNTVPVGRLFGNRGTGKQPARRGRKLFRPSKFPARGSRLPARPGPRPALSPRNWGVSRLPRASRTSSDERPRPGSPSPARVPARARSELTWLEQGAGARGRRCPLVGTDKLSRAPSGHRLVARLGTRGRGTASPRRRAAGGGRGRGRQGRGGRGAAWDLRRPPGAQRVLPPAPPLSPPRPASRSPPPRRVGPGCVEQREIVSTANKKRRHMTSQEEGKRREGGGRRGGTERRRRREPERGKTWAGPAWGAGCRQARTGLAVPPTPRPAPPLGVPGAQLERDRAGPH